MTSKLPALERSRLALLNQALHAVDPRIDATTYATLSHAWYGALRANLERDFRDGHPVENIDDLAGASRTHPFMAAALTVVLFSMAGIPPLAGFFGKLYVLTAAVESGLFVLAVVGVLASVVSCFYYIRLIKIMYFDEATDAMDGPMPRDLGVVLAVAAAVILLFIVVPSPIVSTATAAAQDLFQR